VTIDLLRLGLLQGKFGGTLFGRAPAQALSQRFDCKLRYAALDLKALTMGFAVSGNDSVVRQGDVASLKILLQ
jgi:hypothetical protein